MVREHHEVEPLLPGHPGDVLRKREPPGVVAGAGGMDVEIAGEPETGRIHLEPLGIARHLSRENQ